ncbi:hypothetical protein [Clostridium culturomicium]|uniref:hypothetical protein n=2 Tax=Clostridium culturomicium TaxID=1499683 RepID=UPI00058DDA70
MKLLNKIINTILIIIAGLILGIFLLHQAQMNRVFGTESTNLVNPNTQSFEEILSSSKEIAMEKKILSIRKHYYIMSDGVLIGEVKGKLFPFFGDVLELKDIHGNIIKKESQIKRLGLTQVKLFNVSIDRLAQIEDSTQTITGYIGEEKLKDWWKIKRIQYFYNSDFEKEGTGKPDSFFLNKDFKIFDNDGEVDYVIDGNFFSPTSNFTLDIIDNSDIAIEDVIFYTIIENSIINSKLSESGSSSSSTKTK